eukprot:392183_1
MTTLVDFSKQLTPYYTTAHQEYRLHIRKFIQSEILPNVETWCKNGNIPNVKQLIKKMIKHGGLWSFPFGLGTWNGNEFDEFYQIIFHQEFDITAIGSGLWIHAYIIDPLRYYGTSNIHKLCLQQIANGDAFISLAISELKGGSNVAEIETFAQKQNNNWIINGSKYWITNGGRADYFLTLVRTSIQKGRDGLSVFLIPRNTAGVYVDRLNLQGHILDFTACITFKNVIVPNEYIVGELNKGFKIIVNNFNRERFNICCRMVVWSSLCINECIQWCKERKTFGKKLINFQVIRHKIANMSRKTIACQSMLERIAFQLKQSRLNINKINDASIPRNIALLKVECSKTCQYCTIEASQCFGGRSYVMGGRGAKVERLYRMIRAMAIGGGSEEILLDFAVRQCKL